MGLLRELFVWWGGNTWGTRWETWRHGRRVGTDAFGNTYYEHRSGKGPLGKPRRWVVYRSEAEPSRIPPDWHGWIHYTVDEPPTATAYTPRPWEKPHQPNLTGTPGAYRPQGSILASGKRVGTGGDYRPWRPDGR